MTSSSNNTSECKRQPNHHTQPLLPFNRRGKANWFEWVYRHRVGLLVTVVVYLSLAIFFVSYRIVILPPSTIVAEVEFQEEEKVEHLTEEQIQDMQDLQDYLSENIQNKVSSETSQFNEALRDNQNTNASKIYEDAERMQRELEESRQAYERSLREIERAADNSTQNKQNVRGEKSDKNQDAFVKGNVTTAFTLEGRTAVYIDTPAYKCWGGGQVLVNISVNRNGKVTSAQVEKATSTTDRCLINEAIASAKASTFNASISAPDPQRGTILFTFVAQ